MFSLSCHGGIVKNIVTKGQEEYNIKKREADMLRAPDCRKNHGRYQRARGPSA